MSNMELVTEWLRLNGPATEDVLKERIGSIPAHQMRYAVRNASSRKRIHPKSWIKQGRNRQAVWAYGRAPDKEAIPDVRGEYGIGRVSSVWDLGRI